MGGSLGSKKLNQAIRENLEALLQDYQIIHLTGHGLVDSSIDAKGYVQYEFVKEELTDLLAITDTVVSRADLMLFMNFNIAYSYVINTFRT